MLSRKAKRGIIIVFSLLAFWGGCGFMTQLFRENLEFYLTPTQILVRQNPLEDKKIIRIGGVVVQGSILEDENGHLKFDLSDGENTIAVNYTKFVLPPMFKEGKGVVARGTLKDLKQFEAIELISKHDENYSPPK